MKYLLYFFKYIFDFFVRIKHHCEPMVNVVQKTVYLFPFITGFYNPVSKEKGGLTFNTPTDVPQDEKYHLYKIGRATIMCPLYLYYYAWAFRGYLTTLGIIPEERDIWLSIKFQGPTFVPGSTKENAILIDRAFEVKEDAR